MELAAKYSLLKERILHYGRVAVAYSGGFDSTFLLKVCHDLLGDDAIAVSIRTDLQPAREYAGSSDFIAQEGIRQDIIRFNDYSLDCFKSNPPDRCYHCKKEIFSKIMDLASRKGFAVVADGSNVDDLGDYRPGRRAVAKLQVESPLLEAGMTKNDIRILSKELGLHTWSRCSPACMASRFPYGTAITAERIAMLNAAEQVMLDLGFYQFRVRYHGEVARIEVAQEETARFFDRAFMRMVAQRIKQVGFSYVSLDLEGYRTGSMNEQVDREENG